MTRRLPPLNALRAFEAAARHASFTGAAGELNVSHAAISRHVHALEARLGTALFRRAARGVELTEAGAAYLADVGPAFDRIAEATERLGAEKGGSVRVSAEPTFAAKWLVPALGEFQARHPDVTVAVSAVGRLVDLSRHEADVALRYGRGGWPGVEERLIARCSLYPVAAPRLLGRRRGGLTPDEVARLPLLHEDGGGLWRRWLEAAGVTAAPAARAGRIAGLETMLAIEAAVAGHGAALATDVLVAGDLAARRLVRLSDVALSDGGYFLLTASGARQGRPVAAFCDWLLAASAPFRAAA